MGSLLGHITAFSILFPLAIQRLWSSLSLQARSAPSVPFHPRPWYFSASDHPLRRNAAIYLSLLLLLILLLLPFTIFASLQPICTRHVASLILFFLLLALILLVDSHRILLLPDGALFFLSAFAFLADSALSNPNSDRLSEVDYRLRWLTAGPTIVCAIACIVLAFISSSAADVALSIALALKGSWELQVGLTFYVLKLRGCSTAGGVRCELHEDATRGMHMLDLLYSMHVVAIASVCLGMQWIAARWVNRTAETEAMLTRLVQVSTSDLEFD